MLGLAAAATAAATKPTATTATRIVPGYRAALWMQFQSRFLGSTPGWMGHAFQWASDMDDSMREKTPATTLATTALPLILIGQQQSDRLLLRNGLHMYSRAVGLLGREMQTQQTPRQMVNSLLTCLAMLNIELMYSAGHSGNYVWLIHVTGIASLMSRMNPKMFQDELHSVFLFCRTTLVRQLKRLKKLRQG